MPGELREPALYRQLGTPSGERDAILCPVGGELPLHLQRKRAPLPAGPQLRLAAGAGSIARSLPPASETLSDGCEAAHKPRRKRPAQAALYTFSVRPVYCGTLSLREGFADALTSEPFPAGDTGLPLSPALPGAPQEPAGHPDSSSQSGSPGPEGGSVPPSPLGRAAPLRDEIL